MKIAVIGCGYWGKNLVRNFFEIGVLDSVCDLNYINADNISKKYDVPSKSFDEILNSPVDGIVIATEAKTHYDLTLRSLKKNKNVFVEKPISTKVEHANELIKIAEKNKSHLMVGHLLQYHPVFQKMKEIILSGQLGKILSITSNRMSFGKIRNNENVIWSFAPHDISMILSLVNSKISEIDCRTTYLLNNKIADTATIALTFKNMIKAQINVSWLSPYKEQKIIVIGEKAIATFDDTLEWSKKLLITNFEFKADDNNYQINRLKNDYIAVKESEPLKSECEYFVKLIKSEVPPLTDGHEALKVLEVLSEADMKQMKINNLL